MAALGRRFEALRCWKRQGVLPNPVQAWEGERAPGFSILRGALQQAWWSGGTMVALGGRNGMAVRSASEARSLQVPNLR